MYSPAIIQAFDQATGCSPSHGQRRPSLSPANFARGFFSSGFSFHAAGSSGAGPQAGSAAQDAFDDGYRRGRHYRAISTDDIRIIRNDDMSLRLVAGRGSVVAS